MIDQQIHDREEQPVGVPVLARHPADLLPRPPLPALALIWLRHARLLRLVPPPTDHEQRDVVPALARQNVVRGGQEADVRDLQPGLFAHLARRAVLRRLAELEVAAGEGVGAGAVGAEALADEEGWVVGVLLRGGGEDEGY